MRGIALSALLGAAGLVAAVPYEVVPVGVTTVETKVVQTVFSTNTAAPTPVHMVPCANPNIDQDDLENLKATKDASLRYAESMDDIDQEVATLKSDEIEYPLVQLEDSSWLDGITCNDKSATVVFKSKEAYDAAAADWKTHEKFIVTSFVPECGALRDSSKRDFMLASKITPDAGKKTIKLDITFVEIEEAFGSGALITCEMGRYNSTGAAANRMFRRGFWDNLNPANWGIEESGSTKFDWNVYPTNEMQNDYNWGNGFQLFKGADQTVACVGCGTDGEVTLTGTIEFTLGDGFKKGEIKIEGRMKATLALGLQVNKGGSVPIKEIPLGPTVPLTPFSIAGLITLGPQINIAATAELNLDGQGGMVIGATLDWPNFKAVADAANGGSASSEGLSPNITPKTQFDGEITATLDIGVPISIGVGLVIKAPVVNKIVFDKQLALIDTPGFQLNAKLDDADDCEGLSLDSNVYNNVDINVFDIKEFPVASWSTELFRTCVTTKATSTSTTEPPPETTTSMPLTTGGGPLSTGVTGTGAVGTGIPGSGAAGSGTGSGNAGPTLVPGGPSAPFGNGTSTHITRGPGGPRPTGTAVGSGVGSASTFASEMMQKRYAYPYPYY